MASAFFMFPLFPEPAEHPNDEGYLNEKRMQ
jgi:hypothetical protein